VISFKSFNENKYPKDINWNGDLVKATKQGIIEKVKKCLKNGANIDYMDISGYSSLMNAARYGDFEMVKYLIDNGADICKANRWNETPLYMACAARTNECDKILDYMVEYVLKNQPEKIDCVKTYASDKIKADYPELFRGSNVGLWDLKTNESDVYKWSTQK
jgi:ankyrin repeat protein